MIGEGLSRVVSPRAMRTAAGLLFMALGLWYIYTSWG
jgi:putative Ca2+/H+ antiporter (TMEM165/GDT1 family)